MQVEILPDAASVARRAAAVVAAAARAAVSERGRFLFAVSGGTTPWEMLRELAHEEVPWHAVHVFQTDERVAPDGGPERNLTRLRESLLSHAAISAGQVHPMPVEASDLTAAARDYEETLARWGGTPPVLDLVHLGLGPDGHTASLVPGDPVLGVDAADVAVTGEYNGRRRMTLTYPVLGRARGLLWLVTGANKAEMLARLCGGDRGIPGGRVRQERAVVLADAAAGARLGVEVK